MITQDQIEKLLDAFEQDTIKDEEIELCIERNTMFFEHAGEDLEMLFDDEKEYLFELAIFFCLITECTINNESKYQSIEESNWELLHNEKSVKNCFDYLEKNSYAEPELMAYLEDAIFLDPEDDGDFLTSAGVEIMFIKIKSIVDYILK